MAEDQIEQPVLRRPSAHTSRFQPRPAPETENAVLTRNTLRSSSGKADRQTNRERLIAGDLPGWEPLPPGEIAVRRPAFRP